MGALGELVKIAALAALVALLAARWSSPLTAATIGAAVLYALAVRVTKPPAGLG